MRGLAPIIGLVLGAIALAPRRSSRAGGASAAPPELAPQPGDTATQTLIRQLYAYQLAHLPALRQAYSRDRLRRVAQAAAAWWTGRGYPVDAGDVWGIMRHESGARPLGVTGVTGDPPWPAEPTRALCGPPPGCDPTRASAAYGVGQMLPSRWSAAATWQMEQSGGQLGWWAHHQLLDPRLGVWGIAGELARFAAKHGRAPTAGDVGCWWSGKGPDCGYAPAQAKANFVQKYRPDVWAEDGQGARPTAADAATPTPP